jgi:predicted ester cyclase
MSTIEENKKIALRWLDELWTKGNYEVADEFMAPDYTRHDPFNPVNSPREYCENFIEMYRTAFPDVVFKAEEIMAERDLVFVRWSAIGTNTGSLKGVPPTNIRADLDGMDLLRIQDGKIVESWPGFDGVTLLKKLKVLPA